MKHTLLWLLLWPLSLLAAETLENPSVDGRELLLDLVEFSEAIDRLYGRDADTRHGALRSKINAQALAGQSLPIDTQTHDALRARLQRLLAEAADLQVQSENKTVEFPIAVPVPECTHVDPRDVEVALGGKLVAEEVIAYAKWLCHETVFGENNALACETPEILAHIITATFEFGHFCLGNRGEANIDATLETVRSVGEHLNENVDETITSRASQESLDDLQDSVDDAQDSLDEANQSLDHLNDQTDTALIDLDQANTSLSTLLAQAESLLQRTQINQIEIENIELISSDVQQRAEEIRDDTQALIAGLNSLRGELLSLDLNTQQKIDAESRFQIEFMLSRVADKAPLAYQLPIAEGGVLESVREIVAGKIGTLSALGGDVTAAAQALSSGDGHYNNGQYKSAYSAYSQAYQLLQKTEF